MEVDTVTAVAGVVVRGPGTSVEGRLDITEVDTGDAIGKQATREHGEVAGAQLGNG